MAKKQQQSAAHQQKKRVVLRVVIEVHKRKPSIHAGCGVFFDPRQPPNHNLG
jgi:hypothetical protein